MPMFHKSVNFVKLWFISVWYTPKVAAGGRICWRKKCSTFVKNSPHSSFSYIYNSSIIATMTLLELPCCFSLLMKICRASLSFGLIYDLPKWHLGWIFNNTLKNVQVRCGNWPLASIGITKQSNVTARRNIIMVWWLVEVKIGVGWEEIKIDCAINKNFQLTSKRKEKARKLLYFCIIIDIIFPVVY